MPGDGTQFNLAKYFISDAWKGQIGERAAVEFRGNRITYNELAAKVACWAHAFVRCGVSEGDRIALLLYDSPEFIACFLGALSIGAVCVPINTFLSADDVEFILADSGARMVIGESDLEGKISASRRSSLVTVETATRRPSQQLAESGNPPVFASTTRKTPAFLLYTSGSTGAPKGVLHLHDSIPYTVETYAANVLRLTREDRVYSASRMFFAYGLGNSLSFPLAAGATVILDTDRPTPDRLARLFKTQSPTVFFGVPALYLSLLAASDGLDLSSLRLCVSAGEALPSKIFDDWRRKFGSEILDGIGSTEMLHIFISNRDGDARAGSSGQLVEGYAARLTDDGGEAVGAEESGNLWVRGGSATRGYWNRPELTQQTIIDGWVRTGDVYRRDNEQFFYSIGRSDDCFKVRGLWVSPVEIESVLMSHEAVSEAAIVSSIEESGLATARAYVVIGKAERDEALKEELLKFAGSRLPQYKVPSRIEFIDEMPRTSTGKIQRYKLRGRS
jgi:benzoate-CoA ligase family protein